MRVESYRTLALQWRPGKREDTVFHLLAIVFIAGMLIAGYFISRLDLPEEPRRHAEVPERVARFITQQKPVEPPPKPDVVTKPQPPPKRETTPAPDVAETPTRPRVERARPVPDREPLTDQQAQARERAARSGLLAHMNEMSDLIETDDVARQVRRQTARSDESARQAAGVSADVLTDGASRDSGGVDAAQYATEAGTTTLDGQAGSEAAATLAANNAALDARPTPGNERSDAVRSQEEITLVIDRHKGQLQALYNRARRSNPALKGKLVLSISIAPDGSVTDAEIVSSELNDRALEARILARIKTLQFGARPVPAVTVSYPIEFLP